MKQWFRILVRTIFCASVSAGSGTAFSLEPELDGILQDAGALVTSVPRFVVEDDKVTLRYLGDLNCNALNNLQNCQSYNLVCNFGTPDTLRLDYIGIGVSYVPFTRMIKGSDRFPFIIYTAPIVRRYNRDYGKELDYQRNLVRSKVEFEFTSTERLGEFDAGSYAISWETSTPEEAAELLEMLSSGDLLLLAIPESTNSQTFYHRLPPLPEGEEINLASTFSAACTSGWEGRP